MKSCGSKNATAYSRPVLALVSTARRVWLRNRCGGPMGQWVSFHRFVVMLCAGLLFAMARCDSAGAVPSRSLEDPSVKAPPQQENSVQSSTSATQTTEQNKTEQYTLSHERLVKAVAYSRAGYT